MPQLAGRAVLSCLFLGDQSLQSDRILDQVVSHGQLILDGNGAARTFISRGG
jgi:hypothetical protein